jgi:hypothetical protein
MEKLGVIRPGITPPENPEDKKNEKQASVEQLEQHVTKRVADAAEAAFNKQPDKAVKTR